MRKYELVLMLKPDIDDERRVAVMDRVRKIIGDHAGEVTDEDSWGRRKLAYKVNSNTEANYHLAHLAMEGGGTKDLEYGLKLNEDVLRHLLVRQD